MTKEDRYSHLGDGIEATTDDDAADGDDPAELSVTIRDGDEATTLSFDPEEVSAEDLRAAVEAAEGGDRSTPTDPGRLALELGTLGPRLAAKGMESLLQSGRTDRD
jgi:hypothetical protein